jgi:hypothetical protein
MSIIELAATRERRARAQHELVTTTLLHGIGAIRLAQGAALLGAVILKASPAACLTVSGMIKSERGAARSVTFSGSSTRDVVIDVAALILAGSGPMQVQASAADVVLLSIKATA